MEAQENNENRFRRRQRVNALEGYILSIEARVNDLQTEVSDSLGRDPSVVLSEIAQLLQRKADVQDSIAGRRDLSLAMREMHNDHIRQFLGMLETLAQKGFLDHAEKVVKRMNRLVDLFDARYAKEIPQEIPAEQHDAYSSAQEKMIEHQILSTLAAFP